MRTKKRYKTEDFKLWLIGLIFCFVLLLNFGSTSAQQYQLFPDSNATWLVPEQSSKYTLYHNWLKGVYLLALQDKKHVLTQKVIAN